MMNRKRKCGLPTQQSIIQPLRRDSCHWQENGWNQRSLCQWDKLDTEKHVNRESHKETKVEGEMLENRMCTMEPRDGNGWEIQ